MKFKIPQNEIIIKFMEDLNLNKRYSIPTVKHIMEFLKASVAKGYNGKVSDIAEHSENHRTTIGYFLNKAKWDDLYLEQMLKKKIVDCIKAQQHKKSNPVFVSVDDTVNCKKKPSSKAKLPIESAGFHFSHLLGKQVWGHQVISTMLSCDDISLNYDLHHYDKKQSKIEYVMEMSKSLPKLNAPSYALFDSWFTCPKIINAFEKQGYCCIGALKTNRIIYPQGVKISLSDFASKYIEFNDVSLVTVNSNDYYVYRYEGSLNGIENAVVLISYPVKAFKNPKALKAFICTDVSLDTTTILQYYSNRWCIEIFFKQEKNNLGFDKYQIRTIKGIKRLWLLTSLAHLLCIMGLTTPMPFGTGLRIIRKSVGCDIISAIYHAAQSNVPISVLFDCIAI